MDWKGKLQAARDAGQEAMDQKTKLVLEENWPKIQQILREKVGPAALAAANDNAQMTTLFKMVYAALPFPVHMAVKEDAFLRYCFEHRDKLVASS